MVPARLPAIDAGPPGHAVEPELRDAALQAAERRAADIGRLIGDQPARWLALAGIWLAVAFIAGFGLFVNFQAQGRDATFFATLMAMIPHHAFWVIVSPPIYRALHKTLQGERRMLWFWTLAGWSIVALAGSTAMSWLSYVTRHGLDPGVGVLFEIYVVGPAAPAFWGMNLSILLLALAAFAGIRGLRLRDLALWNEAQSELARARLEAQLADARLAALQAQINPHFLFNSLNAISALIETGERSRATDAMSRLGELLQLALHNGRNSQVMLGDEMDFVERYLELCRLRFDASLEYTLSVPAALRERRVPALIMQPLIENAIRHGMDPQRALGVDIRVYRRDAELVLEVEDDGRGLDPYRSAALPAGHGLANVAERLRLFFGDGAALRLEPRSPRGTRVQIICPA